MVLTDYNRKKKIEVTTQNDSGTTQKKAQPILLVGGDDQTTGTGDIVIDFTNIAGPEDIAIYDQNGNLLDYEIESLDTTAETATIWAYNSWVRDDSVQAQIAYGNNSANTDRQNTTGAYVSSNSYLAWILDGSSSPVQDSSGNDRDGTVNNMSRASNNLFGSGSWRTTTGGDFDENILNSESPPDQDVAFEQWIYIDNLAKGTMLGYSHNFADDTGFSFRVRNTENLSLHFGDTIAPGEYNNYTVPTGEWVHFGGVVQTDGTVEVFADGTSLGSKNLSYRAPGSDRVGIQSGADLDADFEHTVVYNGTRSAEFFQASFDASPKAGQVYFSQQAAEPTGTTNTVVLNGSATSSLTSTGSLTTNILLNGSGTADLTGNGNLFTASLLNGSATANLAGTGNLEANILLNGSASSNLTASGNLTEGVVTRFVGSASSSLTASGDVTTATLLNGSATSTLTGQGDLSTKILLSGTSEAQLDATADLETNLLLNGSASADMTATGNLLRVTPLNGSATADLTASADLTKKALLAGTAESALNAGGKVTFFRSSELENFSIQELHKGGYENAKALLQELVDPADRFGDELFYDRDPRTKSSNFNGYPFVIIRDYSLTPVSKTVNGNVREWTVSIGLEAFSLDEGVEQFDLGDEVADQLTQFIFGETTNILGRDAGLTQPDMERNQRFVGVNKDQQPVSRREIVFTFNLHLSPEAGSGGDS